MHSRSVWCSLVLSAVAVAATPASKSLKDFEVVCDNVADCRVLGLTQAEAPLILDLRRAPGPDGKASLRLRAHAAFALPGIRIDGQPALDLEHLSWRDATDRK